MNLATKIFHHRILPGFKNRAKRVSSYIRPWLSQGDRVLDFGCGNLLIAQSLDSTLDIDILGVDVIDVNATPLPFILYDGKVIPFGNDSFDVTYAAFMLHHTTNTRSLISECIRVTKQRLLILEDVYKNKFELFISKALDHANLLTSSNMNIPFNFRKENEWISLLHHPKLNLIDTQKVRPVAFRPTRHRLFILEVQ